MQLALVNVGRRVSGLQLGLVNVADSSSASVGLLNFISDGIHDAGGEFSEVGASALARLGGRRIYTILSLGASNEHASGVPVLKVGFSGTLLIGLGLGVHTQLGSWSIDPEILARKLFLTDAEETICSPRFDSRLELPSPATFASCSGRRSTRFSTSTTSFPNSATGGRSRRADIP